MKLVQKENLNAKTSIKYSWSNIRFNMVVTFSRANSFSGFKAIFPAKSWISSRHGVVELLRASEQKVWCSKLYRNTVGICQESNPEFKSATLLQQNVWLESECVVVDIH